MPMTNIYVHVIRILDFPLQHGIIQCFANQNVFTI